MKFRFLLTAGIASAIAFASSSVGQDAKHPTFGAWGVDLSGMDKSVQPGDNFFRYVNGTWYDQAVIPPDRTNTGSFPDLAILSEKRMGDLITALEAKPPQELTADEKQLRDLYDAFMDVGAIEKNGLGHAEKVLADIAAIDSLEGIARTMGDPRINGNAQLFEIEVIPDPKNTSSYGIALTQAGILMPNRDYYLRDDQPLVAAREACKTYLRTMLELAGRKDAAARADAVFSLETAIAKVHWPAADQRNIDKIYNPMTLAELEAYAPGFPWTALVSAEGISATGPKGLRTFIASENTAFREMAKLFAATDLAVWRDWLTVHYLHHISAFLPKGFDDADFAFFGKVLAGQQQQRERKIRGLRLLDARLGETFGKLYVASYFPPEAKAKASQLVANLLKAYDEDIRTISWMTDATRQNALDKLHAFTPHIGYPDKWRDYSDLVIRRNDLVGNIERTDVFHWRHDADRLDAPVDRNEWNMTPPTVNAYYTPLTNSIFFPAAILQPPFFDPNADDAVNYGGIGAVIGHEISHGFDDQGSRFDGVGNLKNWWTDADRKAFEDRATKLGAQYDSYEPLPGLHVNGKLTMGENIGDLSGIAIALRAYHISLGTKPSPRIDDFTGDQRFFLGYAQIWRAKPREAVVRRVVLSDPHSPAEFRVLGITRNIDSWYEAFGIKPGTKYYLSPEQRVKLW